MALTNISGNSFNLFDTSTTDTTTAKTKNQSTTDKINQAFSYATKETNDALGKDTFLKLMISKLSNQDPLDPTDDSEFLSQLAQYTTMEQMMNMSETMTLQQGFDMVGKYVIVQYNDSYFTGTVDSVIYDKGEITLDVGGIKVSMDAVKEVMSKPYTPDDSSGDTTTDSSTDTTDKTEETTEN